MQQSGYPLNQTVFNAHLFIFNGPNELSVINLIENISKARNSDYIGQKMQELTWK